MNKELEQWFRDHYDLIKILKQKYWSHPETAYQEYTCCDITKEYLLEQGFSTVETFDAQRENNPPNTVIGRWGQGSPVIGFIGELDALPGLGQEAVPYYSPKEGAGHGCGHCLIATAGVTAAAALKQVMETEKRSGTIVYIGCPAEEVLSGKALLARDGYFDCLDVALLWHPFGKDMDFNNMVMSATTNIVYEFTGKTAHAASVPYLGRSALDAAELMSVGVQYLREHVTEDCRMHHVYIDGGEAPNIVPEKAKVYYFLRSKEENNDALVQRVEKIAKGAAMMTETCVSSKVVAGCHSYRGNRVLAHYGYQCAKAVSPLSYTLKEQEFAKTIRENALGEEITARNEEPIPTNVIPPDEREVYEGGSTDVGDLGMICPTYMFTGLGAANGLPGHHWSITSCVGTSIGLKAAVYAAEIMSQLGYEMLTNPKIIEEAKEEHKQDYQNPYVCKIKN